MLYREIAPTDALARFVECFWTLDDEGGDEHVQPELILPDGCVELILNFASQFRELTNGGEQEAQPCHFLVGQMTRPILIEPTGAVRLIGIRFHPGGTFPFFRFPMHEATNRVIELGAISGDFERELVIAAEEASSLPMKIVALERVLIGRVRNCKQDFWLIELAANIVRSAGRVSVDKLAASAGVSTRQLRRRFLAEVGVGPKLFSRLLRFQQVFQAVDQHKAEWAAVAVECGYYDQAHLIHDFREFTNQTPDVLLASASPLTESLTRKNRTSGFSNTRA